MILYEIAQYMNISVFSPNINVLCLGVFDMPHVGHMTMFQNASQLGTKVFVGIHSDKDVEFYKCTPYMTMKERIAVVEKCKGVDIVIPNAPLYISEEFIDKYNIHVVVCSPEYDSDDDLYYKVPRKMGILQVLPRTKGMSSSELRKRIINRK